ncbi:MAG: thioredoxin [Nitrospinae bacterium]|nr:thioredoxin [Nitrospinota bacterium]
MNQESVAVSNAVIHIDDDDFETLVIQSKKPALVDFWADWCQPCHMMAPTVEALAKEYGDRLLVAKLDVDANPMTTAKYGIRGIPALLLFKNGQLVERIVGVKPKEEIARSIEQYL